MNVYKYRSGSVRDIEALMNNQFFSASLESLNDIQEAKIKINNTEIDVFDLLLKSPISQSVDNSFKNILESFINEAKKYGIYSLSKNYDNELLWAYYSNAHQGFCIEYDLDILKQCQLNQEFLNDVEYHKDMPVIKFNDMFEPKDLIKRFLATKSIAWKHEEEFRVITGTIGLYHFYNRSVKSIYFGYRTPENTIKLIMSTLRGRGIKYYKMHPKQDLYELEKIEIEDIYKDYSIYANKTNKFIPEFDEETEPYKDLILKAIIIVEQELVCEKVLDAYISHSKGTKENPVFFVTYENKIKNLFTKNYYISKEEIEEVFYDLSNDEIKIVENEL
ncbi:MAG: DUF2971 domain-containing protein [Sulfurimonas sp.]